MNNHGLLNIQACTFLMFWNRGCTQSLVVSCKYWVIPLISTRISGYRQVILLAESASFVTGRYRYKWWFLICTELCVHCNALWPHMTRRNFHHVQRPVTQSLLAQALRHADGLCKETVKESMWGEGSFVAICCGWGSPDRVPLCVHDEDVPWGSLPWWPHQMETFSALLAICAGNSPVPGEFPAQKPVTWNFNVFFVLRPNELLSKQLWGWWFKTPSHPLWRHRNATTEIRELSSCQCSCHWRHCRLCHYVYKGLSLWEGRPLEAENCQH